MSEIAIIFWIILLATSILGLRLSPRGADGKKNLISAHGLVTIMFLIWLIIPSIAPVFFEEGQLTWARNFSGSDSVVIGLALVLASLSTFLASYRIFQSNRSTAVIELLPSKSQGRVGEISILLGIIGLGFLLKATAVQIGGGLDMTITRMSGGVSESLGISRSASGALQQVRSFSMIGDLAAVWLFAVALARRRGRLLCFALLIMVMMTTIAITGKRLYTVWPITALALSIAIYIIPVRPRHLLSVLAVILILGWLSLSYRIFAPLIVSGTLNNFDLRAVPWAQGSMWRFYFNSLEFAFFDMIVAAMRGSESVVNVFGGRLEMIYTTQIEPLSFIIPRAIWPGKPELYLDLAHGLASVTLYEDVETVGVGFNSSLVGTAWLSGGPVGVILAFFVLGFVAAKCDNFYYSGMSLRSISPLRILVYSFMLMVIFHLFRQGTLGWVFMIVIVQQLGGIFGILILWLATKRAKIAVIRENR